MSTPRMHRLISLGALAAALFLPAIAVAQSPAPAAYVPIVTPVDVPTSSTVASPTALGPRLEQAGITRSAAASTTPAPMREHAVSRDVAWMLVGGAALVVGSMVGGDGGTIIMITGGVIGLMGLFRFLQ